MRSGLRAKPSSNRLSGPLAAERAATEALPGELSRLEQERSPRVDPDWVARIIRLCEDAKVLSNVRRVHEHILAKGRGIPTTFVGNLLIRAYGHCGGVVEARRVFDSISAQRNDFSWGCMLTAYTQNGHPHEALKLYSGIDVAPNAVILATALGAAAALGSLDQGRAIHERILSSPRLKRDVVLDNALLSFYAKCGCVTEAKSVFDQMQRRTVVSWNAMVAAYAQNGHTREAVEAYHGLCRAGVEPNDITFTTVLSACAELEAVAVGRDIHARVVRGRRPIDAAVANALITMYGKCKLPVEATAVFETMEPRARNVCSWSAIVGALAEGDQPQSAVTVYRRMQLEGIEANPFTFASVLRACLCAGDLGSGRQVHDQVLEVGLESSVTLGTTLVALYSSQGKLHDAEAAFEAVKGRDAACWTAIILAYARRELPHGVLALFKRMKAEGVAPTRMIYALVTTACTAIGAFAEVKAIHAESVKADAELGLDLYAEASYGTSLVSMYSKSGSLEEAKLVFDRMEGIRDVCTWSSLISGYAKHGSPAEALSLFRGMQLEGVAPNEVTFIAVLHACAHGGTQRMGRDVFLSMQADYWLEAIAVEHYGAMVDLLSRVGLLDEAEELVESMPFEPGRAPWNSLLSGCRAHKDVARAARVAARLADASPRGGGGADASALVQLSNLHAATGDFAAMSAVRGQMLDRGIKKRPGCSSIEVDGQMHDFTVGADGEGEAHPRMAEIMKELSRLSAAIRAAGYVPQVNEVLHDVKEEEKELLLCLHSEKLAIAFGVLSLPASEPLRVFNTLRICSDCHSAAKFMSKVERRVIVVRDSSRFHRFVAGACSCGDFW